MFTPTAPQVGQILAGKYRVERQLGEGGMGYVLAARHLELDEPVAVKLVHGSLLSSERFVQRFLREAKRAVKIKSEHVVRVLDVARTEAGEPFIVMEYLEGCDLAEVTKDDWGKTPKSRPEVVVDWLLQAMDALAEAHALGIVHRDLKPANLFLAETRDGLSIKVLDFGVSKALGPETNENASVTHSTEVVGSPHYMSPEQMSASKHVDARADVWSIGVILYRLLSGTLPFDGDTLPEIYAKVYSSQPAPLRTVAPHLPEGLDAVVERCLVKDPAGRMPSVIELAQALLPYAPPSSARIVERIATFTASRTAAASEPDVRIVAPAESQPGGRTVAGLETSATVAMPSPLSKLKTLVVIGAGVTLVLGITAIVLSMHVRRPPEHSAPAAVASETAAPPPSPPAPASAEPPPAPVPSPPASTAHTKAPAKKTGTKVGAPPSAPPPAAAPTPVSNSKGFEGQK
jgi:serine/threonine protein kinase